MNTRRLFINGEVITVNASNEVVEAIAIQDEKIMAVGSNEDILALRNDRSEVIDLNGKTLMPGMIDTHVHISMYGANQSTVSCKEEHIVSIKDLLTDLKKQKESIPKGQWIRAWGYNDQKIAEERYPTIEELDSVSTEHPIIVVRACGHISTVNSYALKLAGIDKHTPDPQGGIYERDENGELTGVLIENATMVMNAVAVLTDDELDQANEIASKHFSEKGITSVHDATGYGEKNLHALQRGVQNGLIKQRVYAMVGSVSGGAEKIVERIVSTGVYTGLGDDKFRIGPVKLFLDGSSSGPTVWTREPYTSDPNNYGVYYYDQETVDQLFVEAHKQGWQLTVHAQGDAAIDMILRTIEKANKKYPRPDVRHRIEHAGIATADLVKRIKEQHVIPTPNPAFFYEFGDGYLKNYGERTEYMYPLRTYINENIPAAIGSDTPMTDFWPMRGIHSALTRRSDSGQIVGGDQTITLLEAIRMYTINGAYASFEEDIKGSLEVGKLADLVIFDRSLLESDIDGLLDVEVDCTIIGGEVVYQRHE